MIKKIVILIFCFYVASSHAWVQFDCRDRTGSVLVDVFLDKFSSFNRMETRNLRTGFYSFSYPREIISRCSSNYKCFISNDGIHEFFLRVDSRDILGSPNRFTTLYLEVRNYRTNRVGNEFLNCTKFYGN
jgi:hypothetical protein